MNDSDKVKIRSVVHTVLTHFVRCPACGASMQFVKADLPEEPWSSGDALAYFHRCQECETEAVLDRQYPAVVDENHKTYGHVMAFIGDDV